MLTRPERENQYIEFKAEDVKAMSLAEEIVAFANSEGGEIWIGLEDDGTISGILRDYEEDFMNICRTLCIPPLQPQYEVLELEERRVIRLQVPPGQR